MLPVLLDLEVMHYFAFITPESLDLNIHVTMTDANVCAAPRIIWSPILPVH